MPVTMFQCRACGDARAEYIAIAARVTLDPEAIQIADEADVVVDAPVQLYDAGVKQMPLLAPVYANDTDHEPTCNVVDPDTGPLLRGCINCGTVRMMTRDER